MGALIVLNYYQNRKIFLPPSALFKGTEFERYVSGYVSSEIILRMLEADFEIKILQMSTIYERDARPGRCIPVADMTNKYLKRLFFTLCLKREISNDELKKEIRKEFHLSKLQQPYTERSAKA